LYISGQLSINPETGRVPEGGIKEETKPARIVVPSNNLYGDCLVEIEAIAAYKEVI